ncbi:DNA-binding MarR family transcriptional regulator [Sphingobium sp. OAS761]|nr:DNA-binding MarR family transcriptional regulator [Sphingobium sp. OAS761]
MTGQGEEDHVTGKPTTAAARIAKAIVDLRRNPYNRAIQRSIYSVGDHELTPVQVDILETVMADPGQRMNELAQALGVNASTVSRTILPLVELGLIARQTGENDRRHTRLFPTEAGQRQAATIADARRAMMHAVQGHFAPQDLERFADLLEHYVAAITAEGMAMIEDSEGTKTRMA